MRGLVVAFLVVISSFVPCWPGAHGRALPHSEAGNQPGCETCLVCWVSGEGVSTAHIRESDDDADCRLMLVYIGPGNSHPAICIVVIKNAALAQGLYRHPPAPVRQCQRQRACPDPRHGQPAWVHKGRRLLEGMRHILGW